MRKEMKMFWDMFEQIVDGDCIKYRTSLKVKRLERDECITHPMPLMGKAWAPPSPRREGCMDQITEGESITFNCHDINEEWINKIWEFLAKVDEIDGGKEIAFCMLVSDNRREAPKLGVIAVGIL
jgi:hypothetical protein